MTLVHDAIAAGLAELAAAGRTTRVRTGPLGYGEDLSLSRDLRPDMGTVDPLSPESIAEDIYRELDTALGELIDDPDYGGDVTTLLNQGATVQHINRASDRVRLVAQRDDRVSRAIVNVTANAAQGTMRIEIRIIPYGFAQAFSLVIVVTDGGMLLESVSQ